MNRKVVLYGILLLIMLLGFAIRAKGTILGYFAFTYDPARDMLAIRDLVINHKVSLIGPTTGLPGVFYGPWWYWILVPAFIVSGGDPTVLVLWISSLSVLMIPLGFVLGKKIGGNTTGLYLAFLFCLSPVFISSSVQLWSPDLVPIAVLLSLYFLFETLTNKKKHIFLFGLSVGAVFEFQMAFGMFFTLGVIVAYFYLFIKKHISLSLREVFSFFLGFSVLLLPRMLFDLRHGFLMSKTYLGNFFHPKIYQTPLSLMERVGDRSHLFFSSFSKTFAGENSSFTVLLFLLLISILLFVFVKRGKIHKTIKHFSAALLAIFVMLFVGFVLYPDAVWEYYLIGLPVLYAVLSAIILSLIPSVQFKTMILVLLVILFSQPISLIHSLHNTWEGDASVFTNQQRVLDSLYTDAHGEQFDVVVYTPALLDYQYQYLFLWYGKKKFGYMPVKDSKIVYYILEDGGKGLKDHFLKEHDGDGKVVSNKTMRGNIQLEKRIRENK